MSVSKPIRVTVSLSEDAHALLCANCTNISAFIDETLIDVLQDRKYALGKANRYLENVKHWARKAGYDFQYNLIPFLESTRTNRESPGGANSPLFAAAAQDP